MMPGMAPPGPPGAYMPPYMQPMPYPPGMPPPNGMFLLLLVWILIEDNAHSHLFPCDGTDAAYVLSYLGIACDFHGLH